MSTRVEDRNVEERRLKGVRETRQRSSRNATDKQKQRIEDEMKIIDPVLYNQVKSTLFCLSCRALALSARLRLRLFA